MEDFFKNLGYNGDYSLSNIIDWIRRNYKFNIWVEHGHNKTHDLTTSLGCHRGSYKEYENAQFAGINIFKNYYINKNVK